MFVAICLQKSALPQLPALSIYIYYTAQPKTDGGFLEWGYPQSASSSLDHVRIETHGDDWGSLNFNTNTSKLPRIEGKSEISQAQRFAKPFFFVFFVHFQLIKHISTAGIFCLISAKIVALGITILVV